MEWINPLTCAALGTVCLLVGYSLGSRRARRVKRRVLQELNQQSLDLLDARASISALKHSASQQLRKDNLLKLTLRKLQQANARSQNLTQLLARQNRTHYGELARLRLSAVDSHGKAVKAAEIARQAMIHLKRLERASSVTQTIEVPSPKSYGIGQAVTVSVVDQARPGGSSETIKPVSNRDSARLTKLRSSNEATAPGR